MNWILALLFMWNILMKFGIGFLNRFIIVMIMVIRRCFGWSGLFFLYKMFWIFG